MPSCRASPWLTVVEQHTLIKAKFDVIVYYIGEINIDASLIQQEGIVGTKGLCYFCDTRDISYLFEQAGTQKTLKEARLWYATALEEDIEELLRQEPDLMRDWDPEYCGQMEKLVIIGQHLDKEQLTKDLDNCLE